MTKVMDLESPVNEMLMVEKMLMKCDKYDILQTKAPGEFELAGTDFAIISLQEYFSPSGFLEFASSNRRPHISVVSGRSAFSLTSAYPACARVYANSKDMRR